MVIYELNLFVIIFEYDSLPENISDEVKQFAILITDIFNPQH